MNQFAGKPLNSLQRTALAFLRKHEKITNQEYCRLNNVDSVTATKDLKGLVDSKLIEMFGTRRWAVYRLTAKQPQREQTFMFEESELNPRQKLAVKWIQEKGFITSKQYESLSSPRISERLAQKELNALENKKIIQRIGKARSTRYIISK